MHNYSSHFDSMYELTQSKTQAVNQGLFNAYEDRIDTYSGYQEQQKIYEKSQQVTFGGALGFVLAGPLGALVGSKQAEYMHNLNSQEREKKHSILHEGERFLY